MIYLFFDGLPPGTNELYITSHGRKVLSDEGRKWKERIRLELATFFPNELKQLVPNVPFTVCMQLWLTDMYTKGKGAKSKFRRFDATNHIKVLEDVIKELAGDYDDCQNVTIVINKRQAEVEATHLWAWNLEREASPFDGPLAQLPLL